MNIILPSFTSDSLKNVLFLVNPHHVDTSPARAGHYMFHASTVAAPPPPPPPLPPPPPPYPPLAIHSSTIYPAAPPPAAAPSPHPVECQCFSPDNCTPGCVFPFKRKNFPVTPQGKPVPIKFIKPAGKPPPMTAARLFFAGKPGLKPGTPPPGLPIRTVKYGR